MRREQIHKICLNHLLSNDIEYKVKDPKSWQFIANDYSDGNYELDNFCLRFKTEEIAKEFKKAVDDIRANRYESTSSAVAASTTTSPNVTAEELKNITHLQMNGDFYDYKLKENCSGCRGCSDDNFEFREVKDTNFGPEYDDNPLPLTPPPKVYLAKHNDLSKDTKGLSKANESIKPNPFAANGGFSFGAAIAAATAAATDNTSTQPTGMFFGNNSFKFNTSTSNGNGDGNLFGGNITSSPAETIKPSFTFNSSTVFGGSKRMCAASNIFLLANNFEKKTEKFRLILI